jgi:glycosyltransferase involved in cell wall biosynthesis
VSGCNSRAQVKVFLPTYRRPKLLPRALDSLLAQTFQEWECEVHNDDPTDTFPGRLIESIGDRRIQLHQHQRNIGANATFNLIYRPVAQEFYSLLEDDNWWEPEFLDTMIGELRRRPDVAMAWCNQKIWQESPDGTWRDTGRLVTPAKESAAPEPVGFGQFRQIAGALHSNGAMMMRSHPGERYEVPIDWPFVAVEPFRERMLRHPLLFVPKPLAVYCKTKDTARSESKADWLTAQSALAATFLKHCRYGDADLAALFVAARRLRPPLTTAMILAAAMEPQNRSMLRHSRPIDWFILLRGLARRPRVFYAVLRSRRRHPDWWNLLDRYTAARFEEPGSQFGKATSPIVPDQSQANCGNGGVPVDSAT